MARRGPVPDLQQRQQQPVEPPPLQQAELRAGAAQLAEEDQQRHLVGGDPVLDAEDIGVHHAVRHHRVEVQALVHARHGGTPRPPPAAEETRLARRPIAAAAAITWAGPRPIRVGGMRRPHGAGRRNQP